MADIIVPIAQLQVGHYIKLPLSWKSHPFLRSSFCIKSQDQIQTLRSIGFTEIVVDPDKSTTEVVVLEPEPEMEPEPEPEPDPTIAAYKNNQQQMRRAIRTAERAYTNSITPLRESLNKLNQKPDEALAVVAELIRNAAAHLTSQEGPVGLQLVRAIQQGDPLLLHSLNVAFISMLIAREAGWSPLEIEDAGLAGLTHDIGELKIPIQISRKRTELTKPEINFLQMHCQYGFDQLNALGAFSPRIRDVSIQHHESLDGSGYPKGLKGEQISPLTRLVAVADYYDENLHPRNALQSALPNQVMAKLYKRAGKQLDNTYIQVLIKVMGIYPPGCMVRLSDDNVALVMTSDPTAPLKPCVLPFIRGAVQEGVDLLNLRNATLSIVSAVDPTELTSQQRDFFNLGKRYCYYFSSYIPPILLPDNPT